MVHRSAAAAGIRSTFQSFATITPNSPGAFGPDLPRFTAQVTAGGGSVQERGLSEEPEYQENSPEVESGLDRAAWLQAWRRTRSTSLIPQLEVRT